MNKNLYLQLNKSTTFTELIGPGWCVCNLKLVTFKLISRIDILRISWEATIKWIPQDLTDN